METEPGSDLSFLSVLERPDPHRSLSPQSFYRKLIRILTDGPSLISAQSPHPNSNCQRVHTCNQCLLLHSISTISAVFQFMEEITTASAKNSTNMAEAEEQCSSQSETSVQSFFSCKREALKWYKEVAALLVSRKITEVLVQFLICSNTFTSFLARKALLSMAGAEMFELSHLLNLVKECWSPETDDCITLVEVLRDLMSRKKFPNTRVNSETFLMLRNFNFLGFLEARFCETSKTFIQTNGLIEYVSLLHKIIKYVNSSESASGETIISDIVNNILLPYGDYFCFIDKANEGHLVCLQYMKLVNSILDMQLIGDLRQLTPHTLNVISVFMRKVLEYSYLAPDKKLTSFVNFIGTDSNLGWRTTNTYISPLQRQITLAALKACTCMLKGGNCFISTANEDSEIILKILSLFCCLKAPVKSSGLQAIFADQDDQWVTALNCLLIIDTHMKKWSQDLSIQKDADTVRPSIENLRAYICPHRLFHELAEFVGYDHLVLTDFLTSPETPFLSYLIRYLHLVVDNWQSFVQACFSHQCTAMSQEVYKAGNRNESDIDQWSEMLDLGQSRLKQRSCQAGIASSISEDKTAPSFQQGSHCCTSQVPLLIAENLVCLDIYGDISQVQNIYTSSMKNHSHVSKPLLSDASCDLASHISQKAKVTEESSGVPINELYQHNAKQNIPARSNTCQSLQVDTQDYESDQASSTTCQTEKVQLNIVGYSDSDSEGSIKQGDSYPQADFRGNSKDISVDSKDTDSEDNCSVEGEATLSRHGSLSSLPSVLQEPALHWEESSSLEKIMDMLIRLRLFIERLEAGRLLQYSLNPLLKLIEMCESLYEQPDQE